MYAILERYETHRKEVTTILIYEYKIDANKQQVAAIEKGIRVVQFIRNKCIRLWMDGRGITRNDLQCSCAELAKEYPFAVCLNSQARQAATDRAWASIERFYDKCKNKTAGKKGYPTFQHDNRSIEVRRIARYDIPDTVGKNLRGGSWVSQFTSS